MHVPFRPAPLDVLARWILEPLVAGEPVMGLPPESFPRPAPRLRTRVLERDVAVPLGVAAGPHTQLAQNLVAAWLCGARFMELKTVQILDELTVPRPCIDPADEVYNCEWSQELTLEQSFEEYLKAWVLVHAAAAARGLESPGTFFAMSVGYDLAGIRSEKVRRFLARMREPGDALDRAIEVVAKVVPEVRDVAIPRTLSTLVTLSTMHGCPPADIERIATHLLEEERVHTWVKLNPTLLGPTDLRGILNETMGFAIQVPDEAFEHDPRFDEAMDMARGLEKVAARAGRSFGLKLSNTLEVDNHRPVFPGEKRMYLSGRALHPLTLTLAHRVTEALDGRVPLSFCGGADANNFARLVGDGVGPITVCSDLLKPGGYARLAQYVENLERALDDAGAKDVDAFVVGARARLAAHAREVVGDRSLHARERPLVTKGARTLGRFDCVAAPCQEACPSHQPIPGYLHLVAKGDASGALAAIVPSNPLPGVTGSICDQPCVDACVRNHYDAPIYIREAKRFAAVHGEAPRPTVGQELGVRVAIVGAGPAGIAAALDLRRAGFSVTLFDARKSLGGVVGGVVPAYRLPPETVARDLERLASVGVDVRLGVRIGPGRTIEDLLAEGFAYVFLAIGAQAGKRLGIPGEDAKGVVDALAFLDAVREAAVRDGRPLDLGRRVLVIGAGNSAMDAARSARRLSKDGEVTLVYRRTRAEMPAHLDEVEACLEEGIGIRDLLAPARVIEEGGRVVALECQRMRLGERDASGRPRPIPVEGAIERVACDGIIVAISQEPRLDLFGARAPATNRDGTLRVDAMSGETSIANVFSGGDAARGPASIIKAIADGRRVAKAIAARHGVALGDDPIVDKHGSRRALMAKRSLVTSRVALPVLPASERAGWGEVLRPLARDAAMAEAARCLDCDEVCSLCVTVCPNRAMQAYETRPMRLELPTFEVRAGALVEVGRTTHAITQEPQIVNVVDFCNECGNCVPFCPTAGAPWRDKPRFHLDAKGFEAASGDAFRFVRGERALRLDAKLDGARRALELQGDEVTYAADGVLATLRRDGDRWSLASMRATAELAEGDRVDLAPLATMLPLLDAARVVAG